MFTESPLEEVALSTGWPRGVGMGWTFQEQPSRSQGSGSKRWVGFPGGTVI